ncbi:tyrosine-type recombinase/integrase [Natranaerobius thermophilus]|uniref:Phage integrase n=1 Tax=Natranaerobius thermophilus (strain ATCC BAA-1301 / DSM 18059 / JW/NM-WN-LF) TaxID=457570 RepID=B2A8P1_NATTJ|nr:integrase domain-containing protein [Natranaerobius thermophilus]ACB86490.1 phage integrase [Natranaerobius thermophilus JW/NM-WN-LF]
MSNPLEQQLEKLYRHCRQGSKGYRIDSVKRAKEFARYIHDEYKVQNFKNIKDQHVASFVKYQQDKGNSDATIKNKLSSIRFFHDQVSNPRHQISDNKTLQEKYDFKFNKTPEIKEEVNRAWHEKEVDKAVEVATEMGREDVKDAITLAKNTGLRISEVTCMERRQAEQALKTGVMPVDRGTKGGRERVVPINTNSEREREVREVLEKRLSETERGGRLFTEYDQKAHQATRSIQDFLINNQDKFATVEGIELRGSTGDGSTNLNFHGLRYCYAQERKDELLNEHLGDRQKAAEDLSLEMGHNRTDVLRTYLAGESL